MYVALSTIIRSALCSPPSMLCPSTSKFWTAVLIMRNIKAISTNVSIISRTRRYRFSKFSSTYMQNFSAQCYPSFLQPGVNRLALQSQHAKDTLMHTTQRFMAHKPLQRLDPQRKLAHGQGTFGP